jgi:hypothetical protein
MVEASLAASAAISGLLVLGILAALTLTRRRHPTLLGQDAAGSGFISERQQAKSWAASTDALFTGFVLFTLGAFGSVLFYVQGDAITSPWMLLSVLSLAAGLLIGSYSLSENAGIGSAGATFVTALIVAVVLVAIITMNLISGA